MTDQNPQPTPTPPASGLSQKIAIIAICLIIPAGVLAYAYMNRASQPSANVSMENAAAETPTTPVSTTASPYKDGTYTATGHYSSPGGAETIGVSLTLKDGVITDATVTPEATRPMSMRMQGMFTENYKPLVVGKSLDEVSLTKVSGSSLTPKGFNDAVAQIKTEAQA